MFFSRTMFSIQTKPLQNETVFFHCTIIYCLSNTFLEYWCSLILKSCTQNIYVNVVFTLKSCTWFVLKNTWIEPKDIISFWKPYISTEIKSFVVGIHPPSRLLTKLVDMCSFHFILVTSFFRILVIFCLFTFSKSTHFARQDRQDGNIKNKQTEHIVKEIT